MSEGGREGGRERQRHRETERDRERQRDSERKRGGDEVCGLGLVFAVLGSTK